MPDWNKLNHSVGLIIVVVALMVVIIKCVQDHNAPPVYVTGMYPAHAKGNAI